MVPNNPGSQPNSPVYIVSGYKRSGTSMMMRCLEAAGMVACYNTSKDKILDEKYTRNEYHPNPNGYYELGRKEFEADSFPAMYANRLIKVLHWRLEKLPLFTYRIVFMLRDPKEIEVSYLKMFRTRPPFILYKYHEMVGALLASLRQQDGIDITTVRYEAVVSDPASAFKMLQQLGWPLTDDGIKKAASCVNPALYRSRKTDLNTERKKIPNLRTDLPDILKS